VTESTRPLNTAIDRLPADVFTGFGQLATFQAKGYRLS